MQSGHDLSRTGILAWLDQLRIKGSSAVTMNVYLAAVKRLAYESHSRGLVSNLEYAAIDGIKSQRVYKTKIGQWTDVLGIKTMLGAIEGKHATRNRAIVACLFGCGLRRSEVCSLDWSQWQLREGRYCWINVRGKGDKYRTIPAPDWVADYINQWKGEQI